METIWHVIDVIQSYTLKISQGGLGNRGLNSYLNSITSLRQVVALKKRYTQSQYVDPSQPGIFVRDRVVGLGSRLNQDLSIHV